MQANKTHISLETAKLLKDCGVESDWGYYTEAYDNYSEHKLSNNPHFWKLQPNYPAYTWQEILWENAEKFFGKPYIKNGHKDYFHPQKYYVLEIIDLLQQKKYQEADEYFRDNNLIK